MAEKEAKKTVLKKKSTISKAPVKAKGKKAVSKRAVISSGNGKVAVKDESGDIPVVKVGRPSKYTKELGEEICNTLSVSIDGLRRICAANAHFPESSTIKEWRHNNKEFSALYEAAKLKQALGFAEDIIDIVDYNIEDMIMTDKGLTPNPVAIARARLRMDARKWIACKLLPKVYGEKVQQEVTVLSHEAKLKELE